MTTDIPLAVNLILAGASLMPEAQKKSFETTFENWFIEKKLDTLIYESAKERDFNSLVDTAMNMTATVSATQSSNTEVAKPEVKIQEAKPEEPKVSFADFF